MAATEEQAFSIKVYTPVGLAVEDKTKSVTLPSSNGEIGILSKHCRYTGVLGEGTLHFTSQATGEAKHLTISGGFCSFSNEELTILADSLKM